MSAAPPTPSNAAPETFWERPQRERWPAWMLSFGLHMAMVTSMVFVFRFAPRGVDVEPDRTTGIVLVREDKGEREYFTEPESAASAVAQKVGKVGIDSPFPNSTELAIDVSSLLPKEMAPGAGAPAGSGVSAPRAGELGGGRAAEGLDAGGTTRTGVFGVYGEGTRFVYVFDRSGSMAGFGGRPLKAAKSELTASLGDLTRQNQFQIIFYNEKPSAFQPYGERPKLQWGDEASKDLAQAFVNSISAAGGTRHMGALRLAIGLSPDVIFFLTDADEPTISAAELARIRRMNSGTAIHAVEFGFGRQTNPNNFLVRLAEQNAGKHVYVDISKLPVK